MWAGVPRVDDWKFVGATLIDDAKPESGDAGVAEEAVAEEAVEVHGGG